MPLEKRNERKLSAVLDYVSSRSGKGAAGGRSRALLFVRWRDTRRHVSGSEYMAASRKYACQAGNTGEASDTGARSDTRPRSAACSRCNTAARCGLAPAQTHAENAVAIGRNTIGSRSGASRRE
jgi:hypothetical protein